MTKRVGVVADDVTGANDIGLMFAKNGLRAGVIPLTAASPALFEGLDVVILDTDSRFDTPQDAAEKVRRATRLLMQTGFDIYHNKTCSVFRGNIGAEFDAMQDTLGVSCSMVVAAFPQNGRTTVRGVHYVNGTRLDKTAFAHDPVHPANEPELCRIIARQSARKTAVFPFEWLALPLPQQRERLAELKRGAAYVVFDARSDQELAAVARLVAEETSLCGASALCEFLPPTWPGPGEQTGKCTCRAIQDPGPGVLMLAGSLTPQTAAQVQYLAKAGVPVLQLETECLFDEAERAAAVKGFAAKAAALLLKGQDVLVTSPLAAEAVAATKAQGLRLGLDDAAVGKLVSGALAAVATGACAQSAAKKLVVAGGDTSAAISGALGIQRMEILDEIEPGLPTMYGLDGQGEAYALVLKSGSFGGAAFMQKAADALRALQAKGADRDAV